MYPTHQKASTNVCSVSKSAFFKLCQLAVQAPDLASLALVATDQILLICWASTLTVLTQYTHSKACSQMVAVVLCPHDDALSLLPPLPDRAAIPIPGPEQEAMQMSGGWG